MLRKRISLIVFTIFIFVNCSTDVNDKVNSSFDSSNLEKVTTIDFGERFHFESSIIKLETSKNCLVDDIQTIEYVDNKYYVLNEFAGGEEELLVFDYNGNLITKIGKKGNGPGEYVTIVTFSINQYGKYIALFDSMKKMIHKYDYWGNYIESIPTARSFTFLDKVSFISKNRMRCTFMINYSDDNTLLCECDCDFDNFSSLYTSSFTCQGGYVYSSNSLTNNGKYFSPPLMNTLMICENDSLKPSSLTIPNNGASDNNIHEQSYGKAIANAFKNGYWPMTFYEFKELFVVQYQGVVVWDNVLHKGARILENQKPLSDCLPINIMTDIYDYKGGFIFTYSSQDIINYIESCKDGDVVISNEFGELFKDYTINDNPIIVRHSLSLKDDA